MKYRGIIFDLDGVICSTDEYHYAAWKRLAEELGVGFTRADSELQRGVSRMESLEVILRKSDRHFTEEEKIALADRKNRMYREMLATMTERDLSENVRTTLFTLKERGVKLAIGSSSKNTTFILERIGLGGFFDAVADGNVISRGKPDPEVFLKAAELLHLASCDCLVVEDALAGIQAANAGGFDAAGIGSAASYEGTTYPLAAVSDLLAIAT